MRGGGNGRFGFGKVDNFSHGAVGSFIAASDAGSISVGDKERIQEFDAEGAYLGELLIPGETVQSLAIDPVSGDLYLAFGDGVAAPGFEDSKADVHRITATGAPVCTLPADNPRAIAVDRTGQVYVIDRRVGAFPNQTDTRIRQYNSECIDLEEPFGEGEIGALSQKGGFTTGLATGSTCFAKGSGLYAVNDDFVFQGVETREDFLAAYGGPPDDGVTCPPPAVPPDIQDQYAISVDSTEAIVRARISPNFWPDTTYYVEYGTEGCVNGGWDSACIERHPASLGSRLTDLTTDAGLTTAGIFLENLQAETTYRYRFVAQSGGGGPVYGRGGKVGIDGNSSTFTTRALPRPSGLDDCPNAALRKGNAATLPDCRAYEMVSPIEKNGANARATAQLNNLRGSLNQASITGDKITYSAFAVFGDQLSGKKSNQYIATRGPSGWSNHGINAPLGKTIFAPEFDLNEQDRLFQAFTPDLAYGWVRDSNIQPLTPDAVPGITNIYCRDNINDSYGPLTVTDPTFIHDPTLGGGVGHISGYSADLEHTVMTIRAALTPDAAPDTNSQVYDFANGELKLVSVLPNGSANPTGSGAGTFQGNFPGQGRFATFENTISEDGSRIFWTSTANANGEGVGRIYVRIDGIETKPVSTGTAQYWTAAADGSQAIYSEGNVFSQVPELKLYRYHIDTETKTLIAGKASGVLGASEDTSLVYFVSGESLAEGAAEGEPNLYLDEEGEKTFIATLSLQDTGRGAGIKTQSNTDQRPLMRNTRVTPDGTHLAFMSNRSLTGYDNTDAASAKADMEVYLYDAGGDRLRCVSCDPRGVRPSGHPLQSPYTSREDSPTALWAAAWLPTWESATHASRALSEDGSRLFFNSFAALVPHDTNGVQDVYQWEELGGGGCSTVSRDYAESVDGCVSLISTGESPHRSEFIDASPDGDDVFFETRSSIDPRDPGLIDIYDARVGGGYPLPSEPPACVGDACQIVPALPNDPTPASAGFRGAGDPVPGRDCGAQARRAEQLGRRAKSARRAASRSSSPQDKKQLRRRSARYANQAKNLSRKAVRCRNANRRSAR